MQNKERAPLSIKTQRQRKFLLVLPVLVSPFLILLLWLTGIVGEVKAEGTGTTKVAGLNFTLPGAAPGKDSNWNKLKYYEQADRDSAKLRSLLKNDPYRKDELGEGSRFTYDPVPADKRADPNEERVYKKIAAINRELEVAAMRDRAIRPGKDSIRRSIDLPSTDVDRLEAMMQSMQPEKDEDPEMKQYQELVEKLLDLQQPERVQARLREQSVQHRQQVFAVESREENVVSVLQAPKNYHELLGTVSDSMPATLRVFVEQNRFYSLDDGELTSEVAKAIPAVVHEAQTLVSGGSLKLRLLEDIYIGGVLVPAGEFVYGVVTVNGERLDVAVTSVHYRGHLLPVSLVVYDRKDGMAGIHVQGTLTRDVAKRSAAQSMQGLGALNTLDPSLGAQVATMGLNAVQNLVSRKAKLVRVTIGAGYAVLLKDEGKDK